MAIDRCLATVVDGHYSSSKPINSGVPQGSVISPTLFRLFNNDRYLTQCPIQSYADDFTLHYSMSFTRQPSLQELNTSERDATERFTSDLSVISDWGRANLVKFNASKTIFFIDLLSIIFQTTNLFFNVTQMSRSSTFYILRLSFTKNLDWKFHISSLANTVSMKLNVLCRPRQFSPPTRCLLCTCTGALSTLVWSMHHMYGEAPRYIFGKQGGGKSFSPHQLSSSD